MTETAPRPRAAVDERVAILERVARLGVLTTTERLTYILLVAWSEGRSLPALVTASSEAIATAINVNDRTGRRLLDGLQAAGLLRHREGSIYEILVPDATPGPAADQLRAVGGDPQQRLAFGHEDDRPAGLKLHSADIDAGTGVRGPVARQGEPGGVPSRASTDRPSDRSTKKSKIDWEEGRQLATQLARWIPVKPKAAFADAKLLLFAAALTQGRVPAIALENALDSIKSQRPRNPAALFRVCFGEEVAKATGTPLRSCREDLSALERATRVPDQEVYALLAKLGRLKADSEGASCKPLTAATPEERDEARRAIADARAAMGRGAKT